ncbi:flagellar hook-length control protein FliK [Imhoffiella purpurea]|uniref:Flagellar hook-length control protein-like C-terminal domain-containing protein n=1 Tax=Imhoffiella purpurea TaxID=1249627 RepID=W9VBT0_9GAMM|nr:flagellar hook-length control protein FliK [Imhoffiella purpurea]EXJ16874.1 hypothetical protein D779_2485 [Imhoffiella purpurea]
MMQSNGLQAGLSGLLAQLLGGTAGSNGDSLLGEGAEFLDTLGGQLKEMLVDRGLDPAEIAAYDGQELLAQFVALIQGPQSVQSTTGAGAGSNAESMSSGIDDSSDFLIETPADLLARLLESMSPGAAMTSGSVASGSGGRSSAGPSDESLPSAAEGSSGNRAVTPTDPLGRLLESASAAAVVTSDRLTSGSYGRSSLAELSSFPGFRASSDRLARLIESGTTKDPLASETMGSDSSVTTSPDASMADSTPSARNDRSVSAPLETLVTESDTEDDAGASMTVTSAVPRSQSERSQADRFDRVPSLVSDEVSLDARLPDPGASDPSDPTAPIPAARGVRMDPAVRDPVAVSTAAMPDDKTQRPGAYADPGAVRFAGSDSVEQSSPASQAAIDRLGRLLESLSAGGKVDASDSGFGSDVRSFLNDLARTAADRRASASADAAGGAISDPLYEEGVPGSLTGALQRLAEAFRGGGSNQGVVGTSEARESSDPVAVDPEGEAVLDARSHSSPVRSGGTTDPLSPIPDQARAPLQEEGAGGLEEVVDASSRAIQGDADASGSEGVSVAATASTNSNSASGSGLQRAGALDLYRLLQPGGEAALGDEVRWALSEGLSKAEMRLQPPSLGSLDVKITMEGDKASVLFVSPHPVVREVLEAAMPRLRDALAQDGLSLANLSVADQGARGGDASGRDGTGSNGSSSNGTFQQADALDDDILSEPPLLNTTVSALSKRLDYYI